MYSNICKGLQTVRYNVTGQGEGGCTMYLFSFHRTTIYVLLAYLYALNSAVRFLCQHVSLEK